MTPLILPGSPAYFETLANVSMFWNQQESIGQEEFSLVYRPGSLIPEAVSSNELIDYLYGGEYDERLDEVESSEDNAEY